jgi:cell division protein ZapB
MLGIELTWKMIPIEICERLNKENQALRQEQQAHIAEHASLIKKHETANARIEEMIERLKSIENSHE